MRPPFPSHIHTAHVLKGFSGVSSKDIEVGVGNPVYAEALLLVPRRVGGSDCLPSGL